MKTYKFKFPFQGNRKGDTVTEDRHGQLLVKAGSNNVMWGPKDVFRAESMGMIEENEKQIVNGILAEAKERFRLRQNAGKSLWPFNGISPNFFAMELRMQELTNCQHPSPRRENDELFCEICKKRWEAKDEI